MAYQTLSAPPTGYVFGPSIQRPGALTFVQRERGDASAGFYDYALQLVGDNWSATPLGPIATIEHTAGSSASVRYRGSATEPSCGFLIWRRGPYSAGTAEGSRGSWVVGCPENAGPWPETSIPVIPHHGGDFWRYRRGGTRFVAATFFSQDGPEGAFYRPRTAKGPLELDGTTRSNLATPTTAPDLTLLYSVPNVALYVALAWVDCFGRESALSTPTLCPVMAGSGDTSVEVSRRYAPPIGAVAFRVYAGTNPAALKRQRVFDRVGATATYDWPIHLTRFYLHSLDTNTSGPSQGSACQSWLNPIQADIVAGKPRIDRSGQSYNLYCPLILDYNPAIYDVNLRVIGSESEPTKLTQVGDWTSPAIVYLSRYDTLLNIWVTHSGVATWASSDFSGGQAFAGRFVKCIFTNTAQDGYGVLVDDCSSYGWGEHTCSETVFRSCIINASRPIKLEGRQTAKVRFDDRCTLNVFYSSRYPSEVCVIEHFAPAKVVFDTIEGVNGSGNFRTFLGLFNNEGPPIAVVKDFFIDRGCSVLFAFGPNQGGQVFHEGGDRVGIYAQDRTFFRIAEAPNSRGALLRSRGLLGAGAATALCYNLNQLALDLDFSIREIVTPSQSEWTNRGLSTSWNGYDFTSKPVSAYVFGLYGQSDTITRQTPTNGAAR